jgi:hypothetical protein
MLPFGPTLIASHIRPRTYPYASVHAFNMSPVVSLFEFRGDRKSSESPLKVEALEPSYGYTLYEYTATPAVEGNVYPGDRPWDRVVSYVKEKIQRFMESQFQHPLNVSVSLQEGDKLQLLVATSVGSIITREVNPYVNKFYIYGEGSRAKFQSTASSIRQGHVSNAA